MTVDHVYVQSTNPLEVAEVPFSERGVVPQSGINHQITNMPSGELTSNPLRALELQGLCQYQMMDFN